MTTFRRLSPTRGTALCILVLMTITCLCTSHKFLPWTRQRPSVLSNSARMKQTTNNSLTSRALPTVVHPITSVTSVRGGGSDFDLAKCVNNILSDQSLSVLFAASALAHGLVLVVSPNSAFALCDSSVEKETLGDFLAQMIGSINIGMAVTIGLLSFDKTSSSMSIAKAVGWGMVPRMVVGLKNFINGNLGKVGFLNQTKIIAAKVVVATCIIGSLISEKGNTQLILKILSAMEILSGLYMTLKPEWGVNFADIDKSSDDYVKTTAIMSSLAQGLLSHGVYVGFLLEEGGSPFKALGAASAVSALGQIFMVATDANEDLGMAKRPFVRHAIVMGATALKLLSSSGKSKD